MQRRIDSIWGTVDRQGREATVEERREVQDLLRRIDREKARELAADALKSLNGNGAYERGTDGGLFGQGPGDIFIGGFKSIAIPATRPQRWTTGKVEVGSMAGGLVKGTLLEGTGAAGSGTGGGLIPAPQVIPGVVEKLFQPLTLEALMSSGVTNTNTVRYAQEGTATSGAAGVPEAGEKPQSTLALSTVDEPVKKIATSLVVSDELLDDSSAVQQFVNGRLRLFVRSRASANCCAARREAMRYRAC